VTPLRVGVIGTGWVARERHLASYAADPRVRVVALFDSRPERARSVAEEMGLSVRVTASVEDMLDEQLDVVSICSSPWSHAEISIAALRRGCNVLTEKPMAMNATEAAAMVEAAEASGKLLCVSHNFLFSDAAIKGRSYMDRLGELRYVHGVQLSSAQRRLPTWYQDLPGGLLFDELPHMLYMMGAAIGDPHLAYARAGKRADGHPLAVEMLFDGTSAPGQVTTVFDSALSEWHIVFVGSEGVMDLDLFRDFATFLPADGAHKARDIFATSMRATTGHWRGFTTSGVRLVRRRAFWGHQRLISAFIDAVVQGGPSPVDLPAAAALVGLTDEILQSIGATGP
jgi:scyllo-inositol 2-dehydrogenase (NADP+)